MKELKPREKFHTVMIWIYGIGTALAILVIWAMALKEDHGMGGPVFVTLLALVLFLSELATYLSRPLKDNPNQ